MKPPTHPLLAALLRPAALLFGAAVRLRNRHYDRPGRARQAGVAVVSIGNLSVGGTGKTPLVAWLAGRLQQRGLRPAVVSRGYGGNAGRGPLVVSDGRGPRVTSERCGDEPLMLARRLPGVPVIVGADRLAGCRAAALAGARVVILDDGFQHRRLARDLDVVLLDAGARPERQRLLPAGPLREPLTALRRADVVVLTRIRDAERARAIEQLVRRYRPEAPVLRAELRATGFVGPGGEPADAPPRAVAFCAIGNPGAFREDLRAAGVELVLFRAFRDHHVFSPGELRQLRDAAEQAGAPLVTTEKDLARLAGRAEQLGQHEPLALRIEVVLDDESPLLDAVLALAPHGAGR